MSFRQYGGTNYAAKNNIVKNNYTNSNNLSIMKQIGQPVSAISVQSGLYLTNNIVFEQFDTPVYGIKYSDGTFQTTAKRTTDTYWQPINDEATPPIYYTNQVAIGADPSNFPATISPNLKLAVNGSIGTNGIIYSGTYNSTSEVFTNTLKLDNTTGSIDMSGNLTLNGTSPTINATNPLQIKSGGAIDFYPTNYNSLSVSSSQVQVGVSLNMNGNIITNANSITSKSSSSSGLTIANSDTNSGGLTIQNQQTISNLYYRQYGTTNSHIFQTNASGTINGTTNLTLSNTTNTSSLPFTATVASSGSATRTIQAIDTTANKTIALIPTTTNGNLNPMCIDGDSQFVTLNGNGPGTSILSISTWTNTTCGIRMTGTQLNIGAGGTTSLAPSSAILFNSPSNTATLTGNLTTTSTITAGSLSTSGNISLTGPSPTISSTNGLTIQSGSAFDLKTGSIIALSLASNGAATFNSSVSASSLTITNNASIGGTATITGAATFNSSVSASSLTITNNASIGGTATITGLATFNNNITMSGSSPTIYSTSTATKLTIKSASGQGIDFITNNGLAATNGLQLASGGAATFNSSVSASSLTITNNASIGGTATITGAATINGLTVGKGGGSYTTNTIIGYQALLNNTGADNTALGYQALLNNTTQNQNTALGYQALYNNNNRFNTAVGYNAGYNNKSDGNTFLGMYADLNSNSSYQFSTAIGYSAKITASNQIALGTGTETIVVQGGHNWRYFDNSGRGIYADISLNFPFYQVYPIYTQVATSTITIQLPTPTSQMTGAHFLFKKVSSCNSNPSVTIKANSIVPYNSITQVTSVTITNTQYQSEIVCNGAIYYQYNIN